MKFYNKSLLLRHFHISKKTSDQDGKATLTDYLALFQCSKPFEFLKGYDLG